MSTNRFQYPEPRFPHIPKAPRSVDDLMPAAERAVRRTAAGRSLLGKAQPGEKVLIVAPPPPMQDPMVIEAITRAFRAKNIEAKAVFYDDDEIGIFSKEPELLLAEEGWKEVMWRDDVFAMLPPEIQAQRPRHITDTNASNRKLKPFLEKHREFTSVFVGMGGMPTWRKAVEPEGNRLKDLWWYTSYDKLSSNWNDFPDEVLKLVEKKVLEPIPKAQEVRLFDPQGTEVWWQVSEEEAILWSEAALNSGHLLMYPYGQASWHALRDRGLGPEKAFFTKSQGVISGTTNHFGFYPHMRGYLEDGIIVRLEGGGLYGELLREIMAKTKDVQYPFFPKPGYFYLQEVALGTNPKYFPDLSLFEGCHWMANIWERNRSGVLHWGIGVDSYHPEVVKFGREHNVPTRHGWHFHTLFNTYSIKLRGTGEWVKVIDKGRITALDDPEVRALASKYGEPDELLREDWIPAIPGINYPGDYMRDYGRDPASWARKDMKGQLPLTVGVPR